MSPHQYSRRMVLGAALSGMLLPGAVWAQTSDPNSQESTDMRVRFRFADHELTATLYDNPSARDFFSMLPLTLESRISRATRRSPTCHGSSPRKGPRPLATSSPMTFATICPGAISPCSMPPTCIPA